jgi:hypothetical protein
MRIRRFVMKKYRINLMSFFCIARLSQNFSFWESNLRFRGKSGLQAAFSKAIPIRPLVCTNRVLGMALAFVLISCGDVLGTGNPGQSGDGSEFKREDQAEETGGNPLSLEGVPVYWRDSTELWKDKGDVYLAFWPKDADGVPRPREIWGGIPYKTYDQKIGERNQGYLSITLPEEIPDSCLLDPEYVFFSWEESWEGTPGLLIERVRFAGLVIRAKRRQPRPIIWEYILYANMDGRIERKSGVYVDLKKGWNFLAVHSETGEYTRFGSLKELYSHCPFELKTYYYAFDDNPPQ